MAQDSRLGMLEPVIDQTGLFARLPRGLIIHGRWLELGGHIGKRRQVRVRDRYAGKCLPRAFADLDKATA